MQYICLYKEIALQNAFRCNLALLSPGRFSEIEGKNSLICQFLKEKFLPRIENFPAD